MTRPTISGFLKGGGNSFETVITYIHYKKNIAMVKVLIIFL